MSQPFEAPRHRLLVLHVGRVTACGAVTNFAVAFSLYLIDGGAARTEQLVAHQGEVAEVDVDLFGVGQRTGNDARRRRAGRLREIEHDQAAAGHIEANVLAGKEDLHRIVGSHERAILADGIGRGGDRAVVGPRGQSASVAPPIERHQVTAAEDDRLILPSDRIAEAAAEGSTDAYAIFHDDRELLPALVGQVPEQTGVAAGGIEIAEDPAVPVDGGKRDFGMGGRPALLGGANVDHQSKLLNPF